MSFQSLAERRQRFKVKNARFYARPPIAQTGGSRKREVWRDSVVYGGKILFAYFAMYRIVRIRVRVDGAWEVAPPAKFSTPPCVLHLKPPRGSIKPLYARILATSSFSQ